jgi:hypothetical protein
MLRNVVGYPRTVEISATSRTIIPSIKSCMTLWDGTPGFGTNEEGTDDLGWDRGILAASA